MSVAGMLWAAKFELDRIEENLVDACAECFGDGWEDFSTDHYDNSIEVWGICPERLDATRQAPMFHDMGFRVVWFHCHASRTLEDGTLCRCPASVREVVTG